MKLSNLYSYLLLSIFALNFIGCSSVPLQSKQTIEQSKPELDWLSVFNLNATQRHDTLKLLDQTNTTNDALLRAILLTHENASAEDLKEAVQLLENNAVTTQTGDLREEDKLRQYILKLNYFFQAEQSKSISLQEQINAYKRLLKKQQHENNVLENKIEALTDIEHQINLRPNKNTQELTQ